MSATTFLTTDQLAERIQYDARTIREQLKDSVLLRACIMCALLVAERFCICGNVSKMIF